MHQLDRPLKACEGEQAAKHRIRVCQLHEPARTLRRVCDVDDGAQAGRVDELELVEIDDQVMGIVEIRNGATEARHGGAVELARDGQADPIATRLP